MIAEPRGVTGPEREEAADWDRRWESEPLVLEASAREATTPRWKAQERVALERFGTVRGLRVIEIGAGRGTNAVLYAQRGAHATVLDLSPVALGQARRVFEAHGLTVETVRADVLDLPTELRGAFDVSMSFGLCEHFLGERRLQVVASHLELLRPGGIAMLGVPNRFAPVYRLWLKTLMLRGTWPLRTEVPFSPREIADLARRAGGTPLDVHFGSFLASVVGHGVNQVLYKAGRRGLPIPQVRTPLLDRLAYELLLPVARPGP